MGIEEFLHTTSERYDVILADPAWTYDKEAPRGSDRIGTHYNQMTTEEICRLPVQNEAEVKPEIVHAKNQKKCMQKFEVEVI
jgi:N6-adenosine-specific RNA methylase IME4